jgi:thiamine-phosphate pyrophosphorylase
MTKACELYPRVPASLLADQETRTGTLLRSGVPALLLTGLDQPGLPLGALRTFVTAAKGCEIAVLIDNDAQLAKELKASGVHLSTADANALVDARALLGNEALIGASCGFSRHDAMTLGESGADYVAFGEGAIAETASGSAPSSDDVAAMIQWWSDIFEIPCVAWGQDGHDEAALQAFISAGADYLSLPAAYWLDESAADKLLHLLSICTAGSIRA